jgi:hypothetical protein
MFRYRPPKGEIPPDDRLPAPHDPCHAPTRPCLYGPICQVPHSLGNGVVAARGGRGDGVAPMGTAPHGSHTANTPWRNRGNNMAEARQHWSGLRRRRNQARPLKPSRSSCDTATYVKSTAATAALACPVDKAPIRRGTLRPGPNYLVASAAGSGGGAISSSGFLESEPVAACLSSFFGSSFFSTRSWLRSLSTESTVQLDTW